MILFSVRIAEQQLQRLEENIRTINEIIIKDTELIKQMEEFYTELSYTKFEDFIKIIEK